MKHVFTKQSSLYRGHSDWKLKKVLSQETNYVSYHFNCNMCLQWHSPNDTEKNFEYDEHFSNIIIAFQTKTSLHKLNIGKEFTIAMKYNVFLPTIIGKVTICQSLFCFFEKSQTLANIWTVWNNWSKKRSRRIDIQPLKIFILWSIHEVNIRFTTAAFNLITRYIEMTSRTVSNC